MVLYYCVSKVQHEIIMWSSYSVRSVSACFPFSRRTILSLHMCVAESIACERRMMVGVCVIGVGECMFESVWWILQFSDAIAFNGGVKAMHYR